MYFCEGCTVTKEFGNKEILGKEGSNTETKDDGRSFWKVDSEGRKDKEFTTER